MDDLLAQFIFKLKVHNRAESTRQQYLVHLKGFFEFLKVADPTEATVVDLQKFQVHLIDQKLDPRTINGKLAAVKFFYKYSQS